MYGKDRLTAGAALALSRGQRQGLLDADTRARVRACASQVTALAGGGDAVYGINTGFGPLCSTRISAADTGLLQHNLLRSHSVGVGPPIPPETARLMLVLKLHALAQGYSGIGEAVLDRIAWHIAQDIVPLVPSQGSVGASGDLAPLAHLFLPLIGEGQVYHRGQVVPAAVMLQQAQLPPLVLGPKEGLALINGTQFIAAHAVQVVERLHGCLSQADLIAALMIEGLLGSAAPFRAELHALRPFPGNQHVAARIAALLGGSEIIASHAGCDRVQDPYSLRCVPQVHGASRAAWLHLRDLLDIELNAVTDNPVILDTGEVVSGGHFHGQPLALALDYACLAAAELGNISDRRSYLSLTGVGGLPRLLMQHTGINSGFMILQYTTAALASENKSLCFPASADSIPTSLGQEDHVSMGSISGRKALQVCGHVEQILAIELLCAAQALDFRRPLHAHPLLETLHAHLRSEVPHAAEDRLFAPDIQTAIRLVQSHTLLSLTQRHAQRNDLCTPYDELFEVY
ncbi:MAG: histidine ammonia-lyase [Bacteroidia bacterium]